MIAEAEQQPGEKDFVELTVEEAVKRVEQAVMEIVDDIEVGLHDDVIAALVLLRKKKTATYMRLRAELRKANADVRLPMLDTMVNQAAPADAQSDGLGGVEALVGMVESLGELFIGDDDAAYVRFKKNNHYEVWALESSGFQEWVAHTYYIEVGRVPRSAQLADALVTLGGKARHEGEIHAVHMRVAADPDGGYILDMCDDDWRVIRVTSAGWQILDQSPVRFKRSKGAKALPLPSDDPGVLDDLLKLINVCKEDQLLIITAALECWRPNTAYPPVEWRGEQGSAKSTSASNLRRLIDPHHVLLRANPKSVEDIFVAARQNYVVNYNNLSRLTGEMQDAFCTLSTGGGYAGRKLYTNDVEAVYDAKRPVFINGITTLATQSDLLSRVVRIECPTLGDESRVSDDDMEARFAEHAPKAMRFLLDTFCAALAVLPTIRISQSPRMMDFTKLGEAVALTLEYDTGKFTEKYTRALQDAATQSIESMPVIEGLVSFIKDRNLFSGTVGQLLDKLERNSKQGRDRAWPKAANGLTNAIERAKPALRQMGINVTFGRKANSGRLVTVEYVPLQVNKLSAGNSVTCITSVTISKKSDANDGSDAISGQRYTYREDTPLINEASPSLPEIGTQVIL